MNERRRAVVWDMDGVLVDSAMAQNASWAAMAGEYGVPYDPDNDFLRIFGRHNTEIIGSLWGVVDPAQVARMVECKEGHFRRAAVSLKALPGAVHLVSELHRAGWRQAIGSSAPMENIMLLLAVLGLTEYVQAIVSADDVTRGKPDPQVFLRAFGRVGVEPAGGVVVEDALVGVMAAKSSGAACLAVANTEPKEALLEAGADRVVGTLEDVTVEDLEKLVCRRQQP